MKTSLFNRLATLVASVAITLVMVESLALLGHPEAEAGTQMARASQVVARANP